MKRPYMSGKTASTVSISPRSTRSASSPRVSMPRTGLSLISASPESFRRDEHALQLAVVLERGGPQLAPDAAALDAAEGHLEVDAPARVDRQDPGLDRAGDAQRAADVARPQRPREAVERGVGEPDGRLLAVERQDRHHRPEDLLAGDLHAGRHVAEDPRLIGAAAAIPTLAADAAIRPRLDA